MQVRTTSQCFAILRNTSQYYVALDIVSPRMYTVKILTAWHGNSVELTLNRADDVLPVEHPSLLQWPKFLSTAHRASSTSSCRAGMTCSIPQRALCGLHDYAHLWSSPRTLNRLRGMNGCAVRGGLRGEGLAGVMVIERVTPASHTSAVHHVTQHSSAHLSWDDRLQQLVNDNAKLVNASR